MREIKVNDKTYRYKLGRQWCEIRFGKHSKLLVPLAEIVGQSQESVERGRWKKTFAVKPAQIAAYIKAHVAA